MAVLAPTALSERDHVISYLTERMQVAFAGDDFDQAASLERFIGNLERMSDAEYDAVYGGDDDLAAD